MFSSHHVGVGVIPSRSAPGTRLGTLLVGYEQPYRDEDSRRVILKCALDVIAWAIASTLFGINVAYCQLVGLGMP